MSDTSARIASIFRYPCKGLTAEALDQVHITAEEMLPGDRAFAIEIGSRDFDPFDPRHLPKRKFLQLMTDGQLAALTASFDHETNTLMIKRDGKQVAAGNLDLPVGRQMIEQFLAAYMGGSTARGAPRIVHADGHHFADTAENFISLINLATVRDLERVVGRPVDPMRFRANLYIDGWDAWAETDMSARILSRNGRELFKVECPIERCAATNVDPLSGRRDMQIPHILQDVFGRNTCGLYLTAIADGELTVGSELKIEDRWTSGSADRGLGI